MTYAHEGHDLIELPGDPTFCVTCGLDVMPPGACATEHRCGTCGDPDNGHDHVPMRTAAELLAERRAKGLTAADIPKYYPGQAYNLPVTGWPTDEAPRG